jgi:hypothetical protein
MPNLADRSGTRTSSLSRIAVLALVALGIGCGVSRLRPGSPALTAASAPQAQRLAIGGRRCGVCHQWADPPDAEGLIQPELDGFALRSFLASALPVRNALAERGRPR